MSTRDEIQLIVSRLPDEKLDEVRELLEEFTSENEAVTNETEAAIGEGLNDIQSGRTVTLDEFKRTRRL